MFERIWIRELVRDVEYVSLHARIERRVRVAFVSLGAKRLRDWQLTRFPQS